MTELSKDTSRPEKGIAVITVPQQCVVVRCDHRSDSGGLPVVDRIVGRLNDPSNALSSIPD